MSKKEKATREYLQTLTKDRVIELCLQYINDKNIAEQQLEALMLEISKQEVEQHDLPDYCTRTGTDYTNLGKIEELQRQLAEKDIRIEELEGQFAYECECNMQLVDLQKQLAEKDKEIERLKNLFKLNNEVVINQGKEIFDLRVQVLQQKQNQTQLAIQELEKVKILIQNAINFVRPNFVEVYDAINKQIKELKGEKDDRT